MNAAVSAVSEIEEMHLQILNLSQKVQEYQKQLDDIKEQSLDIEDEGVSDKFADALAGKLENLETIKKLIISLYRKSGLKTKSFTKIRPLTLIDFYNFDFDKDIEVQP